MLILEPGVAIAYTPADLSDALSLDNGIEYVYLGNDIIMTAGIRVNPAKTSLIIDGYCPQESEDIRTLTDMGTDTGQIYVDASPSLDLTFQNIIINGRNYYGMPRVTDYTNAINVDVTYNKMVYTGPQVIYHPRGLARFIDCDITILTTAYSEAQEVAEINRVEIGGNTTINSTSTVHAVFYYYGATTRPTYLKILEGANVNIDTSLYFLYELQPPVFTIEANASLNLHAQTGFSSSINHTLDSFSIYEGASFYFTQNATRNCPSMNIEGALSLYAGSSLYMETNFSSSQPVIRFSTNRASINLYNPKSFVVYNLGTGRAFAFAYSTGFNMTGNQLNYWENATSFPTAGTFEDEPMHKWNRPQYGAFNIQGTTSSSVTSVTSHTFTSDELQNLPSLSLLHLYDARVLSLGTLGLEVDPIFMGVSPISGTTAELARVRVLTPSAFRIPDFDADTQGNFSVMSPEPLYFAEIIIVLSNTPFLVTEVETQARDEEVLTIIYAPETIEFVIDPISTNPYVILPRADTYDPVIVRDTRIVRTEWELLAKITGPLKTSENDVLDDAVIFATKQGQTLTLTDEFQPVHTDIHGIDDDMEITWGVDEGALARITVPMRSGRIYTTHLDWGIIPIGD